MQDNIFSALSFMIAAAAFIFGAVKLFKKRKPLYLKLYICAAGCFALQQLSYAVNIWCGVAENFSIGMLGIFGCNFFLLSANYGTLDKIVDDGKDSGSARKVAVIAPVIMAVLAFCVFFAWKDTDMFCAVMWVLMFIPALPASYFNLKHILLPVDPFEILRAARNCNISALVFYFMMAGYVICRSSADSMMSRVMMLMMSAAVFVMSLCAVKGAEKWGI